MIKRIPKNSADMVLSRCDHETVDCWRAPQGSDVQLAMFLQPHNGDAEPIGRGTALVRFAYRNWFPETLDFKRVVTCESGSVEEHDASHRITLVAARRSGTNSHASFTERLATDAVQVTRGEHGAVVHAKVEFTDHIPRGDLQPFSVTFPVSAEQECPCCSRLYPM